MNLVSLNSQTTINQFLLYPITHSSELLETLAAQPLYLNLSRIFHTNA